MESLFAWKTINESDIISDHNFIFGGGSETKTLEGWSARHFDLDVNIVANLKNVDIKDYINENESAEWIVSWRGDKKFTGSGESLPYLQGEMVHISVHIPRGSMNKELELDLCIISRNKKTSSVTGRLDGSIIGKKTIYINKTFTEGGFFPIREFEGDGKQPFYLEFYDIRDLDMAVPYGVCVYIDKVHYLCKDINVNPNAKTLLSLMIIFTYFQKAVSPIAIEQLKTRSEGDWGRNSIGGSFVTMLNLIKNKINVNSIEVLCEKYRNDPEDVGRIVYEIYSKGLR